MHCGTVGRSEPLWFLRSKLVPGVTAPSGLQRRSEPGVVLSAEQRVLQVRPLLAKQQAHPRRTTGFQTRTRVSCSSEQDLP